MSRNTPLISGEKENAMQDFYSEHVSNDNDRVLTRFPDTTQNPEARAELRETIHLVFESFSSAAECVKNSGRNARRRLYILYYMAVSPDLRPSREQVANVLGISIFTVDKDIAFCRDHLRKACSNNNLHPDAFENLISAIG